MAEQPDLGAGISCPPELAGLLKPLGTVKPHPKNPRMGDTDAIAASIRAHGFVGVIRYQASTGFILAGNHSYAALLELGADRAPLVPLDVSDEEAAAYLLDDNHTSDLARNDNGLLLSLLDDLEAGGFLPATYRADDLDDLRALLDEQSTTPLNPSDGFVSRETSGGHGDPDGAWGSTDLSTYAERYAEQGRRLIVLDYSVAEYAEVVARLDALRSDLGAESNSEAVRTFLARSFPEVEVQPA